MLTPPNLITLMRKKIELKVTYTVRTLLVERAFLSILPQRTPSKASPHDDQPQNQLYLGHSIIKAIWHLIVRRKSILPHLITNIAGHLWIQSLNKYYPFWKGFEIYFSLYHMPVLLTDVCYGWEVMGRINNSHQFKLICFVLSQYKKLPSSFTKKSAGTNPTAQGKVEQV